MSARFRYLALAVSSVALLAACEAEEIGATYRLVRVSGNPLPAVLRVEGDCQHVLRGGEVLFYGTRRYLSSFSIEFVCPGQNPQPLPEQGVRGRLRIARDTAFFSDSTGQRTGFGTLKTDSLVVQGTLHRLVYHRVQ